MFLPPGGWRTIEPVAPTVRGSFRGCSLLANGVLNLHTVCMYAKGVQPAGCVFAS